MPDNDEIEIIDEAPSVEEIKEVPVDDAIEDLKRQIEAERQARIEAERQAQAARAEAANARRDVDDTNIQLVESAIDTLNRETEIAKANLAAAMRAGDHQMAAEFQAEIASNASKLQQLEQGLNQMKSKPAPVANQPRTPTVDDFASRLTPRSADWIRKHPEFVTNPALNQRMISAHNFVVSDGVAPDTDEYFERIEGLLKIKAPAPAPQEDASSAAAKVVQRRDAAPAAAPVNGGGGRSSNVVRLSADEKEMAEMMGMTPQEYAKNKLKLIEEGKMGR